MMTKKLGAVLALALALAPACSEEKKPEQKPAAPATKTEVKPTEAKPVEAPKPADPATAAKPLEGVQPHAFAGAKSLDSMSQFSLGDEKQGCDQYGKDVSGFLTELQTEYKTLQADIQTKGADAMQRFGDFLLKGAATLKGLKVDGTDLQAAHREFVSALETMGQGFSDAAAAVRANDEAALNVAGGKVQTGATGFQKSFDRLVQICGS